jgi:hypothetical protein
MASFGDSLRSVLAFVFDVLNHHFKKCKAHSIRSRLCSINRRIIHRTRFIRAHLVSHEAEFARLEALIRVLTIQRDQI